MMKKAVGLVLVLVVAEIITFIIAAQFFSWWVLWWTLLAVFIGLGMLRTGMGNLMPEIQRFQQMQATRALLPGAPPAELGDGVAKALAGFLIAVPGLLTDVLGLLLLIPAVRRWVTKKAKDFAMSRQTQIMQMMQKQMQAQGMDMSQFGGMGGFGGMNGKPGQNPFSQFGQPAKQPRNVRPTTIDGEAKRIGRKP